MKKAVPKNNRLNRTNSNENGFNMKSNCCTQCGLLLCVIRSPKNVIKEKIKITLWEYQQKIPAQYLTHLISGTPILPHPQTPVNWNQPWDLPPGAHGWCRIGLWLIQVGRLPGRVF